jgi:uroporphyrin-III C-methyltransferase
MNIVEPERAGFVALVGAGPGAADLITVRALRHIERADVILHDSLSGAEVLEYARPDATLVDVGKRAGQHSATQDEIHAQLALWAARGAYVVRLKGGDPFVFGRGGEELLYLAARGVRCEVVPGISSSIAAAEAAHIPVTHRHVSTHFSVITAQGAADDGALVESWAALARTGGTLVFMMGLGRLEMICEALRAAGRAEDTPVAVIEAATTAQQRVVDGALHEITTLVAAARLRAPATVVVGDVVSVRREFLSHGIESFTQPGQPSRTRYDVPV